MKGIETAYFGILVRDVELKTAKSGKPWASLLVAVDVGEDRAQVIQTAVFGETAERLAAATKGTRVYCEGVLTLNSWNDKMSGEIKHGLSVSAFTCQRVGSSAIGRQRPKRGSGEVPAENGNRPSASYCAGPAPRGRPDSGPADFNDQMPF